MRKLKQVGEGQMPTEAVRTWMAENVPQHFASEPWLGELMDVVAPKVVELAMSPVTPGRLASPRSGTMKSSAPATTPVL